MATNEQKIAKAILKNITCKSDGLGLDTFVLDSKSQKWIILESASGIKKINSLFCEMTGCIGSVRITEEIIRAIKVKAYKQPTESPQNGFLWEEVVEKMDRIARFRDRFREGDYNGR